MLNSPVQSFRGVANRQLSFGPVAVLYGEGTPQASRWAHEVMNILWRNWPHYAVAMLDRMRPSGPNKSAKRRAVKALANHIHNHADLIRPSMHERRGRRIGCGATERWDLLWQGNPRIAA